MTSHEIRYNVKGVRGSLIELAKHFGVVTPRTARMRFSEKGWPIERAVTEPLHKNMVRSSS